ncbi:MAG: hypothetical protein ACO1N7_01070 [Sphingobacteriaceae bacterium]
MKISVTKAFPSSEQLLNALKQNFSGRYYCEMFSVGKQKNIFVSASTFTTVRISTTENEINLIGSSRPSVLNLIFALLGIDVLFSLQRKKLAKEIAIFLKEEYN